MTTTSLAEHDDRLRSSAAGFASRWARGLPPGTAYTCLPEVLALYGLDLEMVDAVLRHPHAVEIRPESFSPGKRFPVLGFRRGDATVVLGLRDPARPAVVAVYLACRLGGEHDGSPRAGGQAPGASGSVGVHAAKSSQVRPPTTVKALRTALLALGAGLDDSDRPAVTFSGQQLGSVDLSPRATRDTVLRDYRRIARRVAAIERAS